MSTTVNYFLIESVLNVIAISQMTGELTCILDPDNADQMRAVFLSIPAVDISEWSEYYRSKLRLSLAYYLHRPECLHRVLGGAQELDMPEPKDIVRFFSLLFEVLFPGDNWRSVNTARVVEDNDFNEMIRVKSL